MQLARDIRTPRKHVGYIAYVVLALRRRMRVCMWEGECKVELVATFAPWALELCTADAACDGICCCSSPAVAGRPWVPVSAQHPLNEVKHYVAGVPMGQEIYQDAASLEGFYSGLGIALLGTVTDGDCAIDTMCIMLGLQQTLEQRNALRDELFVDIVTRAQDRR